MSDNPVTELNAAPLTQAIDLVGLGKLAKELRVSYQAVRKWEKAGRLPRTEWTGETAYAETIERLTEGKVTKARLLEAWPDRPPDPDPKSGPAGGEEGGGQNSPSSDFLGGSSVSASEPARVAA